MQRGFVKLDVAATGFGARACRQVAQVALICHQSGHSKYRVVGLMDSPEKTQDQRRAQSQLSGMGSAQQSAASSRRWRWRRRAFASRSGRGRRAGRRGASGAGAGGLRMLRGPARLCREGPARPLLFASAKSALSDSRLSEGRPWLPGPASLCRSWAVAKGGQGGPGGRR